MCVSHLCVCVCVCVCVMADFSSWRINVGLNVLEALFCRCTGRRNPAQTAFPEAVAPPGFLFLFLVILRSHSDGVCLPPPGCAYHRGSSWQLGCFYSASCIPHLCISSCCLCFQSFAISLKKKNTKLTLGNLKAALTWRNRPGQPLSNFVCGGWQLSALGHQQGTVILGASRFFGLLVCCFLQGR